MASTSSIPVQPVRRKHITTACTACRGSKVKCDGDRPRCGNCKARARECVYHQGEDRRSISLRKAVRVFSSRLSELENYIRDRGLDIPAIASEDAALIATLLESIQGDIDTKGSVTSSQMPHPPLPEINNDIPREPMKTPSTSEEDEYSPGEILDPVDLDIDAFTRHNPFDVATHFPADFMQLDQVQRFNFDLSDWTGISADLSGTTGGVFITPGTIDVDGMGGENVETRFPPIPLEQPQARELSGGSDLGLGNDGSVRSDEEECDDMVQQISDRMGSLQLSEDGELRYFGATSNLTLLDDSTHGHQWNDPDTLRARGQALLDAAGLGRQVDNQLQEHLINLYFSWQDPSFHVVDRDFYERERRRYQAGRDDSTFYSEALTNAICAFGALYDTRRYPQFVTPLSDFFGKRAKIWLDIELDSPRVATVQALVILSSFEAAAVRDARGWLYSGMAMRLSFDLGLHADMTRYVQNGRMSLEESEVRRIAFWGSFIVDHLWGFYLGRPPYRINTDEPSVQRPGGRMNGSMKWVPYGLSLAQQDNISALHNLPDPTEWVTGQWVVLCEIMSSLTKILYERVDVSPSILQSLADNTILKLGTWKRNLPVEMQVDLNNPNRVYLPHVLVLHMQYYQFLIYVHRPFVSRQSPDVSRSIQARRACISAAVGVSNLLRIYKSAYTLRYINVEVVSIIFSAAIIFLFASVSELVDDERSNLVAGLDTCCKALAELGKVFHNATRTLEMLLDIKRKWHAQVVASIGSKRRLSALARGNQTQTQSKRRKSQIVPPQPMGVAGGDPDLSRVF